MKPQLAFVAQESSLPHYEGEFYEVRKGGEVKIVVDIIGTFHDFPTVSWVFLSYDNYTRFLSGQPLVIDEEYNALQSQVEVQISQISTRVVYLCKFLCTAFQEFDTMNGTWTAGQGKNKTAHIRVFGVFLMVANQSLSNLLFPLKVVARLTKVELPRIEFLHPKQGPNFTHTEVVIAGYNFIGPSIIQFGNVELLPNHRQEQVLKFITPNNISNTTVDVFVMSGARKSVNTMPFTFQDDKMKSEITQQLSYTSSLQKEDMSSKSPFSIESIESQSDIDDTFGFSDYSPLHWFSAYGLHKLLTFSIKKGANINLKDKQECTPIFWAVYNEHLTTTKLLLKNKSDPNIANNSGITPLHVAALAGHLDIFQVLIKANSKINTLTKVGDNVLMYAVVGGSKKIVNSIRNNVSFSLESTPNDYGETAKDWAITQDNCDILECFATKKGENNTLQSLIKPVIQKLKNRYGEHSYLIENIWKAFVTLEVSKKGSAKDFISLVIDELKSVS